jgi:hypothetical protein
VKSVPLGVPEKLTKNKFSDILNLRVEKMKGFRREGDDLCGKLGRNPSITQSEEDVKARDSETLGHTSGHSHSSAGVG